MARTRLHYSILAFRSHVVRASTMSYATGSQTSESGLFGMITGTIFTSDSAGLWKMVIL